MEVLLTDREMSRGELSRAVLMVETRHRFFCSEMYVIHPGGSIKSVLGYTVL